MFKKIYAIIGFCFSQLVVATAAVPTADASLLWADDDTTGLAVDKKDTSNLLHAFKKGTIEGRFRYFFMSALNEEQLTDYYANAFGGGIKYQTAPFHHFQMALGGFYTFNLGSSNLAKPDSITGSPNRYEIGLFNIQNPSKTNNLYKLEYFNLSYQYKNFTAVLGKQLLQTPFINPQDGRMRPSFEDGLYVEWNTPKNKWEGGWLYNMSPRSTIEWFTVANSIGWYAQGVNADGTAANYHGNLSSAGIGLLGYTHQFNTAFSIKGWNMFVENIFNSSMLELNYNNTTHTTSASFIPLAGLRLIAQQVVHDGGNANPHNAYMQKDNKAYVITARVGKKNTQWYTALNYTRIANNGRYLNPREWGIEPFYTFMYRERNEGNANVNAVMWNLQWQMKKQPLKVETQLGYFALPDVKNVADNKYGMPSYAQLNIDVKYHFAKQLSGFNAEFLYVYKKGYGNTYNNPKYVINKVNMSLLNLILNYSF